MKSLISFIVPAKNEEQTVGKLFLAIKSEMKSLKTPFEVYFIDDGSTDNTLKVLKKLRAKNKKYLKVVSLRGNWGKSTALAVGFQKSKGEIIITMDADLQDEPKEIAKFIGKINEGFDLVSGWKKIRHDPISKVFPSRVLNLMIRLITGVNIHDTNCGYKAYKREVIAELNLYGEQYRYIPIFAAKKNFKITEIVVAHKPRRHGKSKFGVERHLKGFLDLITVVFLTGYLKRPGHFFGGLGTVSFSMGFVIGLYIAYLRFTTGSIQFRHPLLFLGMLLMIIGVQLISTGLIAELILSFSLKKDNALASIDKEYL